MRIGLPAKITIDFKIMDETITLMNIIDRMHQFRLLITGKPIIMYQIIGCRFSSDSRAQKFTKTLSILFEYFQKKIFSHLISFRKCYYFLNIKHCLFQ